MLARIDRFVLSSLRVIDEILSRVVGFALFLVGVVAWFFVFCLLLVGGLVKAALARI